MFNPSKDKIDNINASLQADFNIEELNKYLGIYLERRPYGSIHLRKTCLTQRIINMILGTDK